MEPILTKIRRTASDKILGGMRIFIGVMFFSTGIMKLLVPMLWEAWSGQLSQANIPFYTFNLWFVPVVEMTTGAALTAGFFSRVGSLVVIMMMIVATYVHLAVNDPSLFPLQPEKPIIPLVLIGVAATIFLRGGGAWSLDLRSTN
ncbi:DoxX family protein [candidate division KSB1 bacterium]|nr:DoxX family protein [candidate division KSB1 bacterium]